MWLERFLAVLEYGKEYGHCNVPYFKSYTCDVMIDGNMEQYAGKLGHWLGHQKRAWRGDPKRKLSADQRDLFQMLVDKGTLYLD